MNYAEIREAVAAICRIIESHSGGHDDAAAKAAIEAECGRVERAGAVQGYFATKLGEIRDYADALYSARKHSEYEGGPEQLVVWIRSAANSIERQAKGSNANET